MIKLLKASPFYPSYLDDFYNQNPEALHWSYSRQVGAILAEGIGWADFWKSNLEKTGRYEVQEIITTSKHLQTTWAKENNIKYNDDNWFTEILKAQVESYCPDIFFPHDYLNIHSDLISEIKRSVSSIRLVIGYDGYGLGDGNRFKGTDLIISCAQFICDFYSTHGYETWFMPFGYETSINDKLIKRPPIYDVSFCGSVIVRENFHNERLRMLSEISSEIPLSLWAASFPTHWEPWKKDQLRRLKHGRYKEFIDVWKLGRINQGTKSGISMYQCLLDSKFTLNHHIDVSGPVAGNSRLMEATGAGTCLVTDWKPNLFEFFEPNTEVVTFKTPSEAISKIKYLMTNEKERAQIAQAGQKRTLRDHTFQDRMQKLIPVMENLMK
jgi:spore maturation protein CgeB